MKKKYSVDDLLRQKLGEATPTPDSNALWEDFEQLLEAEEMEPQPKGATNLHLNAPHSSLSRPAAKAAVVSLLAVLGIAAFFPSQKTVILPEILNLKIADGPAVEVAGLDPNSQETNKKQEVLSQEKTVTKPIFGAKNNDLTTVQKPVTANGPSKNDFGKAPLRHLDTNLIVKNTAQKWPTAQADISPNKFSDDYFIDNNTPHPATSSGSEHLENKVLSNKNAEIEPFALLVSSRPDLIGPINDRPDLPIFPGFHTVKVDRRVAFMAFFGSDLEKDAPVLTSAKNNRRWANFGAGARAPFSTAPWFTRAEIWYTQIALPTVGYSTVIRQDLDGQRVNIEDTTWVHRMVGLSLNVQLERALPKGFSLLGGVSASYLPWVTNREFHFHKTSMTSSSQSTSQSLHDELSKTPFVLKKWQIGPRVGLEKVFLNRFFIGASLTQNLINYTKRIEVTKPSILKKSNEGYQVQRNWIAYVGIRF